MKKSPSLLFCLAMDAIGMLTFAIPFLGEFGDIIWAPISAFIFYMSFGGKKGAIGALINFTEELLPFLDFVPTFTIAWIYQRFVESKQKGTPVSLRSNCNTNQVIEIR
jgi:hypothetical protein